MKSGAYLFTTTYIQVKASNEHRIISAFEGRIMLLQSWMPRKLISERNKSIVHRHLDELHAMHGCLDG
jgi:hypothetical protein